MTKRNDFRTDDRWQRKVRDEHLVPFYEKIAHRYMFMDPHRDDCTVMWIQKEIGVDTLLEMRPGVIAGFEEKIVRWPADDEPHGAYALETYSCTLAGRQKEGWMYYSGADTLLYAFEQKDGWLIVDLIPMQPLRGWFFESVRTPERHHPRSLPHRQRLYNYPMFQMETNNRTEMRVVPITEVFGAIEGCVRYMVDGKNIARAPDGYMPQAIEKRTLAQK